MKYFCRSILFNFLLAYKCSHRKSSCQFSGRQSGQALIIILAFSAILGAGLLSIYSTAQMTTAKRELVNAADAAAYSGASVVAQGLNYTAYTNRAILANNALIGQMVAMRSTLAMSSWYWKNTATQWNVISLIAKFFPYVGTAAATVATKAADFAKYWDKTAVTPVKILAEVLQQIGTAGVGLTNQVLWLSQQLVLADSLATFEPSMIKVAKDNAPDAKVDPSLGSTAFGPIVTWGMFATQFKVKVRKSKQTLGVQGENGKDLGVEDEYLNYLTEYNRNVYTPSYLGGRTMLPNAVGLWIAKGCNMEKTGLSSTALAPPAGLGKGMDIAVRALEAFAAVLGVFADPIMCLYERHGGNELVQLSDGKVAWLAVDALAFVIDKLNIHIAMAGGAVISFTEKGKSKEEFPDAVRYFRDHAEKTNASKLKYMGSQAALPADCVEIYNPAYYGLVAYSSDSRTSGLCPVLATGLDNNAVGKGLWGGNLSDTANKTIDSQAANNGAEAVIDELTAPLQVAMGIAAGELQGALEGAAPPVAGGAANLAPPPGISGGVNPATMGLPDVPALNNAGEAFRNAGWMRFNANGLITGLSQRLSLDNFRISAGSIVQAALGLTPNPAENVGGLNVWERMLLDAIGLGSLADLLEMKVSDGVERPRNETLNKIFNVLADGLPPYFWDVRIADKIQDIKGTEADNLVYTDDNPDDYNARRYNLGPLVYMPLTQDMEKIKTAAKLGIGGQSMGLPDYEENQKRNIIRAIGKARIFFRQPSDQWSSRYKYIMISSLTMPYWQVRNESLSYADKWGLIVLDGLVNVYQSLGNSTKDYVGPDN